MNLPNRLTVTRLVLAPVLFIWYFSNTIIAGLPAIIYSSVLVAVYAVMELTDLIDGKIARSKSLVTDLGKVMDPFADVISHLTFFTCFLVSSIMPVWAFIIILWREFSQSFLRMLLMGKGKPMAANIFGKAKTCLYALCSICGFGKRIADICCFEICWAQTALNVLFALATFSSAVSFIIYLYRVKKEGVLDTLSR